MALIKLYEAAAASTLFSGDTFSGIFVNYGWYSPRHDAALWLMSTGGVYKVYRDGTAVRCCASFGAYVVFGYDFTEDKMMTHGAAAAGVWYYNDPTSLKYDPSKVAPPTFNPGTLPSFNTSIWNGHVYFTAANIIYKKTFAGGAVSSFSTTGTLTRVGDMIHICPDGTLVEIDFDNGTYGVARFHNLYTGLTMYESTFDRAKWVWVDTVNRNIWSISLATGKMQVWSFQVAPQNFSAITMGANRCRYRQDDLSVTLRGSQNEPVPNWPVKWTMTTSEGHLRDEVVDTNDVGVSTNLYCGPGVTDYVGASLTIQVETGY